MKENISAPEKLKRTHNTKQFDCGNSELNSWLQVSAFQSQRADETFTFVCCCQNDVIAYYSLAIGAIEHQHATPRIIKKLERYSIPVMIISRLAVDKKFQKQNCGNSILKDAISRTLLAAKLTGIKVILVHAEDENVKKFYQKFDFEPCPVDPFKQMLLLKDARKFFKISFVDTRKKTRKRSKKRT